MRWVTFCSQTGSEIKNLSVSLGKIPDLIITNNYSKLSLEVINWIKTNNIDVFILPLNPVLEDYDKINLKYSDFISLHGFLRIIPKEICEKYEIYNGHPGLISRNPELKGKDPQIKAFKLKHLIIGSVIHFVTPVIDDGKILWESYTEIESDATLEEYYEKLRETSLKCWIRFIKNKYYE